MCYVLPFPNALAFTFWKAAIFSLGAWKNKLRPHPPFYSTLSINIIIQKQNFKDAKGYEILKDLRQCVLMSNLFSLKKHSKFFFFCMIYCLIKHLGAVSAWPSHIRLLVSNYSFCIHVLVCRYIKYLVSCTHFLKKSILFTFIYLIVGCKTNRHCWNGHTFRKTVF